MEDGHQRRMWCMSGGGSTQRAGKRIVGGIRGLTLRRYGNGGIVRHLRSASKMAILLCRWSRPRQSVTSWWRLWPRIISGLDFEW